MNPIVQNPPCATTIPAGDDELVPLNDRAAWLQPAGDIGAGPLVDRIDAAFAQNAEIELLSLAPADWQHHADWPALIAALGSGQVPRGMFYQHPWDWLRHAPADPRETPFDTAAGHPRRPGKPDGEVYRRFDPRLGRRFTLRVIDPARDLSRFVRWMNLPRVAEFWEQAWPEAELAAFLEERLADPHTLPLIGEFDERPFGYFEVYWAAEDRIGPHYAWAAFDRGLHLLVGEEDVRGPRFVDAWLTGLQHYAYLAEPRTTRIVLEPRHDNRRLFRHLERLGLSRLRDFDFPHKRATLVMGHRDRFFREIL